MRKKFIIFMIMMFSFMMISPIASLADGANYESKSTISFKKSPETPSKPGKDDSSVIPDGQKEILKDSTKALSNQPGTKLPKTATNNYNLILLGVILFTLGLVLYTRKEDEEIKRIIKM